MAATLPYPSGAPATMGLFSTLAKQGLGGAKKSSTNADEVGSPGKSPKKQSMSKVDDGSPTKLELILNNALKKRMGMDYLSERSGIDMRKYSKDYLYHKLDLYKTKQKKTVLTRQELIEFA
jgi:hypothetical protein